MELVKNSLIDAWVVCATNRLPGVSKAFVDLAKAVMNAKLEPGEEGGEPKLAKGTNTGQIVDKVKAAIDALKGTLAREPRVVEELVAENDSLAERLEAAVDEVRRLRKAAAADAAAPEGPRRRSGRRRRA